MRRSFSLLCLASLAAAPLRAQSGASPTRPATPPIVHYGKWGAAALFVTFTALGIHAHNQADADYRRLLDYCRADQPACSVGAGGTYSDSRAEAMYQDVLSGDRAARAWLAGGQVALVGAVALFIVELSHSGGTHNIPYEGLILGPGLRGTTRIGLRLSLLP